MDEELYPGERDALGAVIWRISREIILQDPESSEEARQIAAQAMPWEEADAEMKRDCMRTAWAIRQKVLEDRRPQEAPS